MKTEDYIDRLRVEARLGFYDLAVSKIVREIQLDAFKAGMTEAAVIARKVNYMTGAAEYEILKARDSKTSV